ncbi:elongation factor P hydroxylase [Psychrobacter sp. I-STPA6b]|uniref:elongation factor P hydroxylase n=1 Tax=Psychrobacter sp. I-STPA6b TaxID=2585718 RepID=UPI002222FFD6|nr:elongation factor P hydroxylase [Psychrobacter sp. I-STPA6b]
MITPLADMDFNTLNIPYLIPTHSQKSAYIEQHYPAQKYQQQWQAEWQKIHHPDTYNISTIEAKETLWLINVFNQLFHFQNVCLIKGNDEPEYFPATSTKPAQIVFAHGYFSSALHEISHWCVAGKRRRTLTDFGYWYAPDGRNEQQQRQFEQVEIKPQAIECLLTRACQRKFNTSKDNLNADFDTSQSTFDQDVWHQVHHYLKYPEELPKDAILLINVLQQICQSNEA